MAANSKETALWLLERLVPGTGINNIGVALQVDGRLRPDALATSIAILVGRHRALRTVYRATDGELTKEVVHDGELSVDVERLSSSSDQIDRDLTEFIDRPFELNGLLLFRAGLAAHPDGDIFCIAVHHFAFDAASIGVFLRDLILVYDAVAADQPVPPQARERVPVRGEPVATAADLAYWREHLRGFKPEGRDLWYGSPQVPNPSMTGQSLRRVLPAEARAAVQGLQRQVRAPMAPILLAAFCAMLAAHGAGPELVVGTPIHIVFNDQSPDAIGYHSNAVPLRVHVDFAEGFRQLARRVRDVFLAALAHPSVSVEDLSEELPRAGASWETMIYRHMFNFFPDLPRGEITMGGMTVRTLPVESEFSRFDLQLFVFPPWELCFRYRDEILSRADVEALMRRYVAILMEAAENPELPLGEYAGWSSLDREIIDAGAVAAETVGTVSGVVGERLPAGPRIFILAADGRELPVGVRGELCVTGSWATSLGPCDARFRQDARHGRYYPTGELARWCADGSVELLGQISRQAVINGIRISLNDVEAVLLAHPDVTAAAALVLPRPGGTDCLVAFAETHAVGGEADRLAGSLREHALASLALAAVPERVICVAALPRDDSGRVTFEALTLLARKALTDSQGGKYTYAEDALVDELLELWRRHLGAGVTVETNFFAAGGHSLLAARLAQNVEELTGRQLKLSEIFKHPTPATLAGRMRALYAGASLQARAARSAPAVVSRPSAFASWGTAFSCYTSALGVYLAAEDDRWWRVLADGAPYLRVWPAQHGLLRFEHHPRPPAALAGLRARGADDWEEAWSGIRDELSAAGRVIIAADAWNVPWLTSHRMQHTSHWFVLARDHDGYVVDDPLDLVDDYGKQSPVRVRLTEDEVRQCAGALIAPAPHLVLREEAVLGRCASELGRGYRWMVRGDPSPIGPASAPADRHAALELADWFEHAPGDPASYLQIDDIWQALRQRELLVRVLAVEEELGELGGLPTREAWERVTELWRRLPPLLMHARLTADSRHEVGAGALVGTFLAIAEAESQSSATRFPLVAS
jgi:hypothetical protein